MASGPPESDQNMKKQEGIDAHEPEPVELAALADGSLPENRRGSLEARLAEAPELRDLLAEQERAVARARSASVGVEAPPELRERIEAAGRTTRARDRHRGRLVVAAAVPLVALTALVIALSVPGSHPAQERFAAVLDPTGLAPGAHGEATLTKTFSGWRVDLNATGLPRLDGRSFYEAWLRSPAGVFVPIGTFNEPRKVTLWAGVSPKDFTSLTVTREQADGDQSSSGDKVLAGAVVPAP
jgi:hypothetical protein